MVAEDGDASGMGTAEAGDVDATSGTGDDAAWPERPCDAPVPIMNGGETTGLVRCEGGQVDRQGSPDFTGLGSRDRCTGAEPASGLDCVLDDECTDGAFGACVRRYHQTGEVSGCTCTYGCATDADCDDDQACLYYGGDGETQPWPRCFPAGCRTGEDCENGACGLYEGSVCGPSDSWTLACRNDGECRVAADCAGSEVCRPDDDAARWACQRPPACPF